MRKWWFGAAGVDLVLADFAKSAALPTGQVVPLEFMPAEPGSHEFTRQMACSVGGSLWRFRDGQHRIDRHSQLNL